MQSDERRDTELATLLQGMTQQQTLLRALAAARPNDQAAETSEQFVIAIQAALAHDQPKLARVLAQQGHRLYPQHAQLARLATILAPPQVVAALPADPDVGANLSWIKAHRAEYAGQWVAVAAGALRGAAPSLRELKTAVGDLQGMFVTRVL
jgi:hypothetical protein